MIKFIGAHTAQDYKQIETLACTIWKEHYTPIIGKSQVDYMLKKFQSASAIEHHIKNGFEYYFIASNTYKIGYLAFHKQNTELFLSKCYILLQYRGKGFGREAIKFIEQKALELYCKSIYLTVNKNNLNTINAYEKLGFKKLDAIVIAIGNGYVMDDYKMIKNLKN